jgi:hypothetical protein
MRITIYKVIAPRTTLALTTVKVGSSRTATPLKKEEPPHKIERIINNVNSKIDMGLLAGGFQR